MYPYSIQDLGVLPGGDYTYPRAINNREEIVGFGNSAGSDLGFLWNPATGIHALPLIPGADVSTACDINDHGEIVGSCSIHNITPHEVWYSSYATRWKSGVVYNINPGIESEARSINNKGEIAGVRDSGGPSACTWIGGVTKLLAHDRYHGHPTNEIGYVSIIYNGEVYGSCIYPGGMLYPYETATRWDLAGNVHDIDFPDNLDKIGMRGRDSGVIAANDSGVAVGNIFNFSVLQPFFWSSGGKGLLGMPTGSLQGNALDVNAMGQAVGWLDDGTGHRATIWNGPVVTDLNDLIDPLTGWILHDANCINDGDQIAGIGLYMGKPRAYLMKPNYRTIHIPPLFWQIVFGVLTDGGGIQLVGPGGPGPGPDPIANLLHFIPELLRSDLRNILNNQQITKPRGFEIK